MVVIEELKALTVESEEPRGMARGISKRTRQRREGETKQALQAVIEADLAM